LTVRPFESINEVKKMIAVKMLERGDPILRWENNISVTLYGPLAIEEMKHEEGEIL